jgi:hypothetical protein
VLSISKNTCSVKFWTTAPYNLVMSNPWIILNQLKLIPIIIINHYETDAANYSVLKLKLWVTILQNFESSFCYCFCFLFVSEKQHL